MRALLGIAAALVATLRAQDAEPNPFRPFDRAALVAHARSHGADAERIAAYERACESTSVAQATEALLRDLDPRLDAAITLAENGDPKTALELGALVGEDYEPYSRALARYHLGRHLLDNDNPDFASRVFVEYLKKDVNRTPFDAEAVFFYASSLADIPMPGEAASAFGEFLTLFPDAPERFRAVASQRKADLEAQFQSPLHEIADSMKGVGRDLRRGKSGDETQKEQQDIVAELQKIIEEIEEREKQSSGGPGGNSQSNNPASSSALPGGTSRVGSLANAPKAAKRWGNMQDLERKSIEADAQSRLSGPWKKLVEEYYKKLNQGAER